VINWPRVILLGVPCLIWLIAVTIYYPLAWLYVKIDNYQYCTMSSLLDIYRDVVDDFGIVKR
jgi:hypothetical protein